MLGAAHQVKVAVIDDDGGITGSAHAVRVVVVSAGGAFGLKADRSITVAKLRRKTNVGMPAERMRRQDATALGHTGRLSARVDRELWLDPGTDVNGGARARDRWKRLGSSYSRGR